MPKRQYVHTQDFILIDCQHFEIQFLASRLIHGCAAKMDEIMDGITEMLGEGAGVPNMLDLDTIPRDRQVATSLPDEALIGLDSTPTSTSIEVSKAALGPALDRQEPPNMSNHIRQQAPPAAPSGPRSFNFNNHHSRGIRAHRPRRAPHRGHTPFDQRANHHLQRYSNYYDRDNLRVNQYRPRRREDREDSPETRKLKAEAHFLAAMADMDVKEEREDRRDRGGNRGNNKRRRDGELEPSSSYEHCGKHGNDHLATCMASKSFSSAIWHMKMSQYLGGHFACGNSAKHALAVHLTNMAHR